MECPGGLILQVQGAPGDDDEDLAAWTGRLREQLLDLDVESVDPVRDPVLRPGEKGLGVLIGWLAVRLGRPEQLRPIVESAADWASRTGRSVKVSYGGDFLEVSRATRAEQERIIGHFLDGHPPAPDPAPPVPAAPPPSDPGGG